MIIKKFARKRITSLLIIMIFTSMSIYMIIPIDLSNLSLDSPNLREKSDTYTDIESISPPESSMIGTHTWWDPSWPYRILINVTNQESVDLKNYGVSVEFPYGDAQFSSRVNASLKDLRIIEYANGQPYERKFYFFKDYPSAGEATIYFNTNVSASTTETDTYLYFGNMNAESTAVENGLGYVKNGDFEYVPSGDDPIGTPDIVPYSYDPVGWNWSHNVPDNIIPWAGIPDDDDTYDGESIPTSNWQNCLVDASTAQNQVQLRGTYSYKWGTNETIVPQAKGDIPVPGTDDYNGVLYSNSFVVPIVGTGNPSVDKIYLNIWRNIRVCSYEYKTNNDNIDGYFLRIVNASAGMTDLDNQQMLGNYLELFIGIGSNSLADTLRNFTSGAETNTITAFTGDLSGDLIVDLSDYMGENISLQIGMIGDEGAINEDMAFGQIDKVYFTYQVDTELNELQTQKSEITVITRDVDGNVVPNAEVSIVQGSTVVETRTTDYNGEYSFMNMNFGIYNFSVNYTFETGVEYVVFNSTATNYGTSLYNIYNATDLYETYILTLDIWTINFEIVDWDDDPFSDGYVKVYDQEGGTMLKQLQLVNGTAEFRWLNDTQYYYEVYFHNTKYATTNILLNSSYIFRSDYETTSKSYSTTFNVNETNIGSGSFYSVSEKVYTKGSTMEFSLKKLIKANITLSDMKDQIDNVSIYYIDKNDNTIGNNIYENLSYSGEQSDFITLDLRLVDNSKLESENYDAYGLFILVQGQNSSICNGTITIDTIEKCHINNKTAISKMHIRIVDIQGAPTYSQDPVWPASVVIENGSNPITTLTAYEDGWASHSSDEYQPFIYLTGLEYNISLKQYGSPKNFQVNYTNPAHYMPPILINEYNYTLEQNTTMIFDIDLGVITSPETLIEDLTSKTFVTWGSNISITVNISYTTDGDNYIHLTDPGTLVCTVKSWSTGINYIVEQMIPAAGNDNYSITINSSRLLAGSSYEKYWFIISGSFSGYQDPDSLYIESKVSAKNTSIELVDYTTRQILAEKEVSKEYNELINITVHYYNKTNVPLHRATVSFDWLAKPLKYFQEDPLNPGYYFITINTSEALAVGERVITIVASLNNYSAKTLIISLDILERPTALNGDTSDLLYLSEKIWVQDPYNFTFVYRDIISGENLTGALKIASYTWQEIDEDGDLITGSEGTGPIIQEDDGYLILDFDTDIRPVGYYYLYVNIQKENYKARAALINLEIRLREFESDFDTNQINVIVGNDVEFEITIEDKSRDNILLIGAAVSLEIGGKEFDFNEKEPGVYTLKYDTEGIDATFLSQTLSGTIIIEKVNFTTQELDITIVVDMEEVEFWPGMPKTYFYLIVIAILGAVGSLVGYRLYQQARIPQFVKKINKVRGAIKSNKTMPKLSIPNKAEMALELFGSDWSELGLSFKDTVGIQDIKSKEKIEEKKEYLRR